MLADTFVEEFKADLKNWTEMLAAKKLSRSDFEWLMEGKKDEVEFDSLEEAGLAQISLDRFVNGLTDTVVGTAFKVFGI